MVKKIQKKEELHRLIHEYKNKAFAAQMNPHFLFNALNSVQRFVGTNDSLSSQRYLAKFAKLVRGILENSDAQWVSLTSEIELIELYLELEQLRFKEKFKYTICVDSKLDDEKLQDCIL